MLWIPEVYTGSKSNWANLWEKILHTMCQNLLKAWRMFWKRMALCLHGAAALLELELAAAGAGILVLSSDLVISVSRLPMVWFVFPNNCNYNQYNGAEILG